ncbi:MAG: fibronectin type III domain-containing protein [Candidatus Woesearchaeota archaeon]
MIKNKLSVIIATLLLLTLPFSYADSVSEQSLTTSIKESNEFVLGLFGKVTPISDSLILYPLTTSSRSEFIPLLAATTTTTSSTTSTSTTTTSTTSTTTTTSTTIPSAAAPTFSVDIPERIDKTSINIIVTSDPLTIIEVNVNSRADYRRSNADDNGTARFNNLQLRSGQNNIDVSSISATGENNAQSFPIFVDLDLPVLTISEMPGLVGARQYALRGSVNKLVDIEVYEISGDLDNTPPKTPAGLKVNATSGNSVALSWDQNNESDFLQYIIYRSDKGPIATTSPESYDSYDDVLVDKSTRYQYQVSAMDESCLESPKSRIAAVTTPNNGEDGRAVLLEPITVDCNENQNLRRVDSFTTNGSFNITLNLEEGRNLFLFRATDLSNNTVEVRRATLVDSEPPTIEITSPRPGIMIYEHFANSVDIQGMTEPYSKVELALQGQRVASTPSARNPEEALLPELQVTIGTVKESTNADKDGYFEFENVNLMTYIRGSLNANVVRPGDEGLAGRTRDLGAYDEVNLAFRATDRAGKQAVEEVSYTIGTCWSGNFTWGIAQLSQYNSPSWLSAERLSEGTEEIAFYFKFSYHGEGDIDVNNSRDTRSSTRVNTVSIHDACDDYIRTKPDYDWACKALSSCRAEMNPDGSMAYVTCRLNKVDELMDFDAEEWKDWFKAINNEMRFPLMITLGFQERFQGKMRSGSQASCEEVTYAVDNAMINFTDVLPDWLLYDGVRIMQDAIKTIETINKNLNQILEYVTIGCVASFITKFGIQVYRRYSCTYDNLFGNIVDSIAPDPESSGKQENCKACLQQFKAEGYFKDDEIISKITNPIAKLMDPGIQDKIPDACMPVCFEKCSNAWDLEANNYDVYRWACDRVFCHAAPSRWTQEKQDYELVEKAKELNYCQNDLTYRGQPLTAVECSKISTSEEFKRTLTEDTCFEIQDKTGKKTEIYELKEPAGNDVYRIFIPEASGRILKSDYAIKVSDRYYMTAMPETCNEICGITGAEDDELYNDYLAETTNKNSTARCVTVNQCNQYRQEGNLTLRGGTQLQVKSAMNQGFTSDCFYKAGHSSLSNIDVVSKDPNRRKECCCINTAERAQLNYYNYTQPYIQKDNKKSLLSLATAEAEEAVGSPEGDFINPRPSNYSDMLWSYRYWKIGFDNKEYNPDRYIKGRDQSACFGQNNWIFDGFSKAEGGNLLTVDPFKQHTAAFQCACITGIYNRLKMIQNILVLLSSCLIEVRETGKGDAGVCKEVFTQYVCGMLWDIISYIKDGCVPFLGNIDYDKQENEILEKVKVGTTSIFESMDDSTNEISQEYGNAQINSLLGGGQGQIARAICLASFGFDWELSLETMLDAAYSTPFATLVQPITKNREYLSFDPRTGMPKYEYTASWIINPGCEFDYYDVSLVCVSDDEIRANPDINCGKVGGSEMGLSGCDCARVTGKDGPEMQFFRGRTLSNNVLVDQEYDRIVKQKYRFDHLKFTLAPSRKQQQYSPDTVANCFPEGHEDGVFYFPLRDRSANDLIDCNVDIDSGIFYCEGGGLMSEWDRNGNAYFINVELNGQDIDHPDLYINEGQALSLQAEIFNSGRPKCLKVEVSPFGSPAVVQSRDIDFNGSQIVPVRLVPSEDVSNRYRQYDDVRFDGCYTTGGSNSRTECYNIIGKPRIDQSNGNLGKFKTIPDGFSVVYYLTFIDEDSSGSIELTQNSKDKVYIRTTDNSNDNRYIDVDKSTVMIANLFEDGKVKISNHPEAVFEITNEVPFNKGIANITYIATTGRTDYNTNTERWSLTYGLYYLEDDGDNCADIIETDPVVNYNERLEYSVNFYVKPLDEETARTGNKKCTLNAKSSGICDCDGDGSNQDDAPIDCTGEPENYGARNVRGEWSYCYKDGGASTPTCHLFPKCPNGRTTTLPCDCNQDGEIVFNNDNDRNTELTNDVDCYDKFNYCYDSSGTRQCIPFNTCSRKPEGEPADMIPCDCNRDGVIEFTGDNDCFGSLRYCRSSDSSDPASEYKCYSGSA